MKMKLVISILKMGILLVSRILKMGRLRQIPIGMDLFLGS